MFKTSLPVISMAGILAALANNYVFYHDIIVDKHNGMIQQGPYANIVVVLLVLVTIGCFLLLATSRNTMSYFLDPTVLQNRRLSKIQAHLENMQNRLDDQVQENEELRQFIAAARKELGNLN